MAVELFYKKYGEQGPAFLILHGVFGMLDNWHSLSKELAKNYQVYAIDLRNHGHSPHSSEMSYELMADDVLQVLIKENIDECILLGHSMGGKVAMQFAALHPEKLKALIVADIAPKRYKPGHLEIIAALKSMKFDKVKSRADAQKQFSELIQDPGVRNFLLKNLHRNEDGTYRFKMNLPAIEKAYDHIIGEIEFSWPLNVPTLFLKGAKSRYIQPHDQAEIEQWFTEVEFEEVSEAGHWLHADNPQEFLLKVQDFLEQELG